MTAMTNYVYSNIGDKFVYNIRILYSGEEEGDCPGTLLWMYSELGIEIY